MNRHNTIPMFPPPLPGGEHSGLSFNPEYKRQQTQFYIDEGIYVDIPNGRLREYFQDSDNGYFNRIREWMTKHTVWIDNGYTIAWFGAGRIRFDNEEEALAFILAFGGCVVDINSEGNNL